MLGVLCARAPHRPSTLSPHTFSLHHTLHHPHSLSFSLPIPHHAITAVRGGASIWRVIVPSADGAGDWRRDCLRPALHQQKGEGSWNVAWDARPARWLHRLDLAYLLFGVSLVLDIAPTSALDCTPPPAHASTTSSPYRVKGVLADGRCLFRAIAHASCLQRGEEAPDENRERELADELRAQVVEELLRRRKEVEEFFDEDFDDYVKKLRQPYAWGDEYELLMASHVLKKPISVFQKDRTTGDLMKIRKHGEEYKNDKESPINVLFHGYGHYDVLETSSK